MDLARLVNEASVPELILLRSMIDRRVLSRRTAVCTCCQVEKSVDKFSPNPNKKNGLQSWCRDCRNTYRRGSYARSVGKPVQLKLLQFELEG